MADRVVRGARPIRRFPKRLTQWIGSADQGVQSVATGATAILEQNATLGGTTIVRTRGIMSIAGQSGAADLVIKGAIGFGLVSDQAFAAGAASVPGPWSDPDWAGWFLWQAFRWQLEFADATGRQLFDRIFQFDSKAMRKVGANETLVLVAESQTGAFNIDMGYRILLKLS